MMYAQSWGFFSMMEMIIRLKIEANRPKTAPKLLRIEVDASLKAVR